MSDKLLFYLKSHCKEHITLEEIAYKCGYHPSYFSRIFKEYTGIKFSDYLKKVRIERAIYLIDSTELLIEDIYIESGFTDRTHFFKTFRQIMGISPLQYRKR